LVYCVPEIAKIYPLSRDGNELQNAMRHYRPYAPLRWIFLIHLLSFAPACAAGCLLKVEHKESKGTSLRISSANQTAS
jgi:hypothetical protein